LLEISPATYMMRKSRSMDIDGTVLTSTAEKALLPQKRADPHQWIENGRDGLAATRDEALGHAEGAVTEKKP
jgi:hypothetical protein